MVAIDALKELNAAPRMIAIGMLEPIVERSTWVVERAVDLRPFSSDQDVAQSLVDTILLSSFERRITLFRAHPELAGREAAAGKMTEASTNEQSRLGLTALTPAEATRLDRMNTAYSARFGYPFILALHRMPDLQAVFGVFEQRLKAPRVVEHVATLTEIASVISARAARAFGTLSGGSSSTRSLQSAGNDRSDSSGHEVAND